MRVHAFTFTHSFIIRSFIHYVHSFVIFPVTSTCSSIKETKFCWFWHCKIQIFLLKLIWFIKFLIIPEHSIQPSGAILIIMRSILINPHVVARLPALTFGTCSSTTSSFSFVIACIISRRKPTGLDHSACCLSVQGVFLALLLLLLGNVKQNPGPICHPSVSSSTSINFASLNIAQPLANPHWSTVS